MELQGWRGLLTHSQGQCAETRQAHPGMRCEPVGSRRIVTVELLLWAFSWVYPHSHYLCQNLCICATMWMTWSKIATSSLSLTTDKHWDSVKASGHCKQNHPETYCTICFSVQLRTLACDTYNILQSSCFTTPGWLSDDIYRLATTAKPPVV